MTDHDHFTPPCGADAPFPAGGHDHGACVAAALAAAERQCARRGARLTATRRRVLELVWRSHRPVGAYALLAALAEDGTKAAPPTIYRALDFLLAHGLVHRIERLDAFVGCPRPGEPHAGQFLLCVQCGAVAELDDPAIDRAVVTGAARLGFTVRRQTIEAEGLCPACSGDG
jgi:Fur family zinc uptake transcriptional regulator